MEYFVDKLTGIRATKEEWMEAYEEFILETNLNRQDFDWNFEFAEVK